MKQQMQTNKIEWKEVELNELTECLDNKRIPLNNEERAKIQGDIPYYGANGQVDSINKFIFDEKLLLIAEDGGSWGAQQKCAYIIKGKSWVNNHAHVLRIKQDKTNIKFLMYWFNLTNLNRLISGSTRGKLNQRAMNSIKILLPFSNNTPDLKEQERIVKILEESEKLNERGKRAEELLDEFLKSVFYEMFYNKGFEIVELGKIGDVNMCKRIFKNQTTQKGEIPFYKIGTFGKEADAFISRELFNKYKKKFSFPKKGDVLLSASGTIGKHIKYDGKPAYFQDSNIVWIDNNEKKVLNNFLYFFYKYRKWILKNKTTIYRLYNSDLKRLKIPLPPLSLQQKFSRIVEQVEKMKDSVNKTKQNSEELFNSLMSKAFRGEL